MKSIYFTSAAKQRLARYLNRGKKMVLDFEDGVGPFSAIGNCNLDANYRLIFVDQGFDTHDFDEKIQSNIGDIYIKSENYANIQFDDKMEVRFNPRYFTLPLVSTNGVLNENLEVVDFNPVNANAAYSHTHDC